MCPLCNNASSYSNFYAKYILNLNSTKEKIYGLLNLEHCQEGVRSQFSTIIVRFSVTPDFNLTMSKTLDNECVGLFRSTSRILCWLKKESSTSESGSSLTTGTHLKFTCTNIGTWGLEVKTTVQTSLMSLRIWQTTQSKSTTSKITTKLWEICGLLTN